MLIDWFTIGAQIINFLVLIWLLKRFLYRPILDAIDTREQRIATILNEAEAMKAAAQTERNEFRQKNDDFEQQRVTLLSQLNEEIDAERQGQLERVQLQAEDLRAQRQQALKLELQNLQEDIVRRNQQEVFAVARKLLTDLAGTSLEQCMAERFVDHLRSLDDNTKAQLAISVAAKPPESPPQKTLAKSDAVLIRSAFELPSAQRAAIEQALLDLQLEAPVCFEIGPDVINGIELTVNGMKLSWSVAETLASLQKNVSQLALTSPSENSP